MKKFKGLRHGEIILVPRKLEAGVTERHESYILGHSETNHHHVIEGAWFEITKTPEDNIFVSVLDPVKIVHKKTTDKHKTLTIPASVLKRYHDTEYDLFADLIRDVKD